MSGVFFLVIKCVSPSGFVQNKRRFFFQVGYIDEIEDAVKDRSPNEGIREMKKAIAPTHTLL